MAADSNNESMRSDSKSLAQIESEEPWDYLAVESRVLIVIYLFIFLSSIVAAFLLSNVGWYRPLVPGLLFMVGIPAERRRADSVMAATIHKHAEDTMLRYGKRGLDVLEDMRYEIEAKSRGLQILEMHQKPATSSGWFGFVSERLIVAILLAVLICFSVIGSLSFMYLLGAEVAGFILVNLLKRLQYKSVLEHAFNRWTMKHYATISHSESLKSKILGENNIQEHELKAWLSNEIIRLYSAGVHPDNFSFGESPENIGASSLFSSCAAREEK